MSMPGFVFHFRCDSCDVTSGDYSVYVFHDLFRPDIGLPAWSHVHQCWATIHAHLSAGQRRAMESDRDVLLSFAASLSSDSMTVGVPQISANESASFDVVVTPEPRCPHCGVRCQSLFGHPPSTNVPEITPLSAAEFRAAPISLIDLSVRVKRICLDLGVHTLGQLEDSQAQFAAHPRASETAVLEIAHLMSRKPVGGG